MAFSETMTHGYGRTTAAPKCAPDLKVTLLPSLQSFFFFFFLLTSLLEYDCFTMLLVSAV